MKPVLNWVFRDNITKVTSFKYRHEGSERCGFIWRESVVGRGYEKYKEKEARLPSGGLISRINSETSVAGADTEVSKDKIRMVSGVPKIRL